MKIVQANDHAALVPVEGNPTLWRYMSSSKFENLLNDSSIYFCRVDRMAEKEDPFEASLTRIERDWASKITRKLGEFSRNYRRQLFINCWHINDNESDAMWKLYLPKFQGIAIKTNFNRLIDCLEGSRIESTYFLEKDQAIWVSKIRYIDYQHDRWFHKTDYPYKGLNLLTPFVHKRKEFKHENEFRLFIKTEVTKQNPPEGIKVYIPLVKLIDAVILPPNADQGFKDEILKMIAAFNFHFPVRKSNMSAEVFF